MTRILVLFTCHNRKEKTENCIISLASNEECEINYIVLDDNSTDGTKETINRYNNIIVLNGDGNSFYSGGMRQAIAKAKSMDLAQFEYVMFINDDVAFYPNSIDRLVHYANGKDSIITGAVCDVNGNHSYGGVRKASKFKPEYKNVEIYDGNLSCDTTCANCVLIPSGVFQRLPNIDPVYTHAMGDFDYFAEAARRGNGITSSDFYVGICEDNPINGTWRDVSLPAVERIKLKESIKGLQFKQWFHYLKKNYGILSAVIFSITPYIRIILKR